MEVRRKGVVMGMSPQAGKSCEQLTMGMLTMTTNWNRNHPLPISIPSSPQIKRRKKWQEMYHPNVWNAAQKELGSGPPYTIQLVLVFRQDLLNTCKPCISVWILFVQITSSVVKLFLSDPGYRFVLYTHQFFTLGFPPVHTQSMKLWRRELSWQQELGEFTVQNTEQTHDKGQKSSLA